MLSVKAITLCLTFTLVDKIKSLSIFTLDFHHSCFLATSVYSASVFYKTVFGSCLSSLRSAPRRYWYRTYLLDKAALIVSFAFTNRGIKGDIISLYRNEFDSVSALVTPSKQTQQAFGLAYWCPVGFGLWAKMKICSLILRKDVLHPATISCSAASPPALCFPLLACVFCLQGFKRNSWVIRMWTFGVSLHWFVCGNMCMLKMR